MARINKTSGIMDDLLVLVAQAGAIGLTVLAPNAIIAIEKPLGNFIAHKEKRKEAKRIGHYLKRQKLIEVVELEDGMFRIMLTDEGKTRSTKASFERLELPKAKWDQKWRVIMFDIPEAHKQARDYISKHIRHIGFKQLQKSVYIYPYPVDEFVILLKDIFPEVGKYFTYLTVEEIDQHNKLVHQFKDII